MSIAFNRRAADPLKRFLTAHEQDIANEAGDYGQLRNAFFECYGRWPGKERLTTERRELRDDSRRA